MTVEGKVVAITGVTTGIGRAAARTFAREGALVVGAGRRTERGNEIAGALRGEGHTMTFVTADVTRPEDCERFIDAAMAEHGRIDALVNNVGGPGELLYVPTEDVTTEQFNDLIALNVTSAFFCSQSAIRHMLVSGTGSIVNVSSVVGSQAMARQAVYAIGKAALDHLTRCLAVEYLDRGIRVNSVIIGGALTKQVARALSEVSESMGGRAPDPERMPSAVQATPMDQIVAALAFLCGDESLGVTATALAVDRARTAGAVFSAALYDALGGRWTN